MIRKGMSKPKTIKRGRQVRAISGPPHILEYIQQEAHKKRRTFSAELLELVEHGIGERDGEEQLKRLVGPRPVQEAAT